MFGERTEDGTIVKRLADDGGSSSDEDKRPPKLAKILPIKATDLLAAPTNPKPPKKLNSLVRLKTANASTPSASTSTNPPPPTALSTSSAPVPTVKTSLGGLSLLGSYSDSSSQSDSDNWSSFCFCFSIESAFFFWENNWDAFVFGTCRCGCRKITTCF